MEGVAWLYVGSTGDWAKVFLSLEADARGAGHGTLSVFECDEEDKASIPLELELAQESEALASQGSSNEVDVGAVDMRLGQNKEDPPTNFGFSIVAGTGVDADVLCFCAATTRDLIKWRKALKRPDPPAAAEGEGEGENSGKDSGEVEGAAPEPSDEAKDADDAQPPAPAVAEAAPEPAAQAATPAPAPAPVPVPDPVPTPAQTAEEAEAKAEAEALDGDDAQPHDIQVHTEAEAGATSSSSPEATSSSTSSQSPAASSSSSPEAPISASADASPPVAPMAVVPDLSLSSAAVDLDKVVTVVVHYSNLEMHISFQNQRDLDHVTVLELKGSMCMKVNDDGDADQPLLLPSQLDLRLGDAVLREHWAGSVFGLRPGFHLHAAVRGENGENGGNGGNGENGEGKGAESASASASARVVLTATLRLGDKRVPVRLLEGEEPEDVAAALADKLGLTPEAAAQVSLQLHRELSASLTAGNASLRNRLGESRRQLRDHKAGRAAQMTPQSREYYEVMLETAARKLDTLEKEKQTLADQVFELRLLNAERLASDSGDPTRPSPY